MTKGNQKPRAKGSKAQQSPADHLLKGEEVSFDYDATTPTATDEELNSRYAKGEVRIVTESARYSLAGILTMLQETVEGAAGERVGLPRFLGQVC